MPSISIKLVKYLREQLSSPALDIHTELVKMQGGFHTEIYSFRLSGVNGDLSKKLILRLFPKRSTEVILESTVQNALASLGYPTAKAFLVCTDVSILGGPFFIMEHLDGSLLMLEPAEFSAPILGSTHAELHNLSTIELSERLSQSDAEIWHLNDRFDWIDDKLKEFGWINEAYCWLLVNRPDETTHEVICHGDFHGLNVLTENMEITGVLDWTSFLFANPTYDVARTVMIHKITGKHIPILPSGIDWDLWVERYLASYQKQAKWSLGNLDYYIALHCVVALIYGHSGVDFWRLPPIEQGLIDCIGRITSVQVQLPKIKEDGDTRFARN